MDYQEAILDLEFLKDELEEGGEYIITTTDEPQAIDVAISAMQELDEYKQLGTLEELQELVELRKEKCPQKVLGAFDGTEYECQNCGNTIPYLEDYCEWCGQKQDWSV